MNSSAPRPSITERPNELTRDIDISSPTQIVRLLRSTDAQIFSGYGGYEGISDPENVSTMSELALRIARALANPTGRIILSGAGTSGRLAMLVARAFNSKVGTAANPEPIRYTMAGTDLALIAAQEGAEDDPQQGIADLEAASAGASDLVYFGITCGLSAPYIAGQIRAILDRKVPGHAVLFGFNPVDLARNTPIEGWPGSFQDIAREAEESSDATILCPVVGPEPITGSTRMKSGSATKILLEILFHAARAIELDEDDDDNESQLAALEYIIRTMLADYESTVRETYIPVPELADLIQEGGNTLRNGGHIYYLGGTGKEVAAGGGGCCGNNGSCAPDHEHEHDHGDGPSPEEVTTDAGILGLVDASECPPTYGASFDDVRGYLAGGWDALLGPGKNLTSQGPNYRISLDDFAADKLESLKSDDLVVFLSQFKGREELISKVAGKTKTAIITLAHDEIDASVDHIIRLPLNIFMITTNDPDAPEVFDGPVQLAFKLVLNALTTGAHVLSGKVFGNRMIDLKISNNKLFHRTVGIIQDLMGVDQQTATQALVKSVYETDNLTSEQENAPIRQHIEVARGVDKVVPKALLLATGQYTYARASEVLQADPVVRHAISSHVKQ